MLKKMQSFPYERIICLTEETAETLYLLEEEKRIVGVTGYAVRPPQIRRDKIRVGGFTTINIDKVISLAPDLVLSFSDLQADIVSELIKKGLNVYCFNHRTISGIYSMILTLGALTGSFQRARLLVTEYKHKIAEMRLKTKNKIKPRVFFEEWDDPMISAIRWVSELIEISGGSDIFSNISEEQSASDRIVTRKMVIDRNPDIIIASWCGKKVNIDKIRDREGWTNINAILKNQIYEIKSPLILQPGPAALTEGLRSLYEIINS